jgi:hypothetical protein
MKLSVVALDKKMDTNSNMSNSSSDIEREEVMVWDQRVEMLLEEYLTECELNIEFNKNRATCRKYTYILFGASTITFPLVLSILQPSMSQTLNQCLLIGSGVLNGLSSFLNPARHMEIYLSSMNKFIELKTDLKLELTKHKKDRQNPSEYLKGISERFINYQQSTPFF